MRKIVLASILALTFVQLLAQTPLQEFVEDPCRSGSNYYTYPTPTKKLTPAPTGKRPFYISHYGRHGSRYIIKQRDYDYPYFALRTADSLGLLSEKGKLVYRDVTLLREESKNRLGDLTSIGAQQHRDIARRMYERFPEVFHDTAHVDAKSTVVLRCILSMENALQQLKAMNPHLQVTHDASEHDMYYMNQQDTRLFRKKFNREATAKYYEFCRRHENYRNAISALFTDTVYAHNYVNLYRLNIALFKIASSAQGTEVGRPMNLQSLIYNTQELYDNWLQANAYWYVAFGSCPMNGGLQPFTQRNLLRKIISEADSCIALPGNNATLRFGHETVVLPLVCLLGINGFDQQDEDLETLVERRWINYKVFPMGCNIQFIFYRSSPRDKDVLFKVLLNEEEANLPLPTNRSPYYRWSDFKDYFLKKLDTYKD